uniref:Uncharacterized protein n=1 Tax=Arundo donax TaxID=35708 RepID=A0A0A9GVD1_ARUDO
MPHPSKREMATPPLAIPASSGYVDWAAEPPPVLIDSLQHRLPCRPRLGLQLQSHGGAMCCCRSETCRGRPLPVHRQPAWPRKVASTPFSKNGERIHLCIQMILMN